VIENAKFAKDAKDPKLRNPSVICVRVCAAIAIAIAASITPGAQVPLSRDPILVLISFDGWRSDYIDRVPAPNLKALAARGVRARALIPSFPSVTFPNHYTIATGLYPEHHGIVDNTIDDPSFPERFTMSSRTAKDSRWWGGEPIWVTAKRQGHRAMTMFWPGDEAEIGGVRPDGFVPFDDHVSNHDRVAQAVTWLALPPDRRPSVVLVYFSEVDHAGHDFGPDSPQLIAAAGHLDDALGELVSAVRRLDLDAQTTYVVVSDHGMTATPGRRIFADDYVDLDAIDFINTGEVLQVRPKPGALNAVLTSLRRAPHITVYERRRMPERFHYRDNPRIAPIVGLLDEGWRITTRKQEAARDPLAMPERGGHGYDPHLPSMRALFVAAGPRVRTGLIVEPFENVHVYDFLCAVLDLTPAKNDGDAAVARRLILAP
jgi:predicted AlkP superfamily pyrophosphatase or phosphodiesterase